MLIMPKQNLLGCSFEDDDWSGRRRNGSQRPHHCQTKKEGVLVELAKTDPKVRAQFEKAIIDVIGNDASVSTLIPQLTVEILDFTSTSTKADVEATLQEP